MPRPRRAMTIVEVLITLVVIVVVLGPIVSLLTMGRRSVYRAGDDTQATLYATEIVEVIRGAPYGAFAANGTAMGLEQIFKEHNVQEGVDLSKFDPRFKVEATVSEVPNYDPRDMKRIEVHIGWGQRMTDAEKSIVLATFYTPVK